MLLADVWHIISIAKLMQCYAGKHSERLGNAIRRKAMHILFVLHQMPQTQSKKNS